MPHHAVDAVHAVHAVRAVRAVHAVSAVLLLCAPTRLGAQDTRDTFRLEELVVTATRSPTPRASVAASVTVLTGDELRNRGIHQVLDALRELAGASVVQVGSMGGITSLFLRGGESDYVSVLVDGVPLNQPGGAVDLAGLTTDNIDRIEIVRGPASVLYGSDAVAGVVQVFTRRARGSPHAEVGLRAGAFGSVRPGPVGPVRGEAINTAIEWQAGLSGGTDDVRYAFGASRTSTEGLYTTDGARSFNNDYRRTVVTAQVQAAPDPRTEATVSLRYGDDIYHFPTDGGGRLVDHNAFQRQRGTALSLDLGRFLTDRVEARVMVATHQTDGGTDDQPDGPADTLGFYAFESHAALERRRAEARAIVHLRQGGTVTAGAQIEGQHQRSFSVFSSQFGGAASDDDQQRLSRAYYTQVQLDALGPFALNTGVRLEDNESFGTFWTVRGGIVYRPWTGFRLRAAAGTGFKEPTFFENFATGFVRGNPDLRPERSVSGEVGVEHTLAAGRGFLSATYFAQRFRDLIQFTFAPPAAGDPNFLNVAAAAASGVEFEARVVPSGTITANASYTYLHTEVTDPGLDTGPCGTFLAGKRLLRRPTHSAAAAVNARAGRALRLHAAGRYAGERDDCDFGAFPATAVMLDPYAAFDVAVEYDLTAGGAIGPTLSVRVENLFDTEIQETFNFPSRGRTVWLGARATF